MVVASTTLPTLRAHLLLVHPPAFFDFRERRDIYFPFLGTSGDVPITPLYEYIPIGFKTLQRFLGERGHCVRIINLSTILLRFPRLSFDDLVRAWDAPLVGIDLHWMVHVQGSLEVARRIRGLRDDVKIIFGGLSATYYAQELVRYPFIDMVMRGYDTHLPMDRLLAAMNAGRQLQGVPNLLWKDETGAVRDNGFTHKPRTLTCGADWSHPPEPPPSQSLGIREILSTQQVGCAFNCGWCGGSADAHERVFQRRGPLPRKPDTELAFELASMARMPHARRYHLYTIGSYNEPPRRMDRFVEGVAGLPLRSVSYEQFHLTPDARMRQMARANPHTTITLSPESHDLRVSELAGRGAYTNEELEAWIDRALTAGIHQIDIWYFCGMPEQGPDSVAGTVDYCMRLLEKFPGGQVLPMICPMIPFLDPASTFFEYPAAHGYRVFHRSVEEHRRGMERASIVNRLNYETQWLDRRQLVEVGLAAVRDLMQAKAARGLLPKSVARAYCEKIDDALQFIPVVHEADCLADPRERASELARLGDDIQRRNEMVLFQGVMNQAFPISRMPGGRWIDELGWAGETLEQAQASHNASQGAASADRAP